MAESTSMPVPAPPFAEIVADSTSAELKNTKFVMMIGSTGNGKSTLGNFLLCPAREHCVYTYGNQTFAGAVANLPLTQEVKMATDLNRTICLMDTPGLNENPKKDLEHMVAIIRCLKAAEKLTACILCVKFDSKIDMQYKETIEYYSKLFPGIFETNVILVMTCFGMDPDSIERRKDNGIDVAKIRANTVEAVKKCANIKASPKVFMIDCLPTKSGREGSEKVRSEILQCITKMTSVMLDNLRVFKTARLMATDKQNAAQKEGRISALRGEKQRISKAIEENENCATIANHSIEYCNSCIADMRNELSDLDSNEREFVERMEISNWKPWFGTMEVTFTFNSEFEITYWSRWSNCNCRFIRFEERLYSIHGAVKSYGGLGNRRMNATIDIYTDRRYKKKDRISALRRLLDDRRSELRSATSDKYRYTCNTEEYRNEERKINKEISELYNKVQKLQNCEMSLKEATQRIEEL